MNFKLEKNTGLGKPELKSEIIEEGLIREIAPSGSVRYCKDVLIEDLNYDIDLHQDPQEKSLWYLSFSTDYGTAITNKGLKTYKVIIENIVSLVKTATEKDVIKKIKFSASAESIPIETLNFFKEFLSAKIKENAHILDNFSYITSTGSYKKALYIKNGMVEIFESGKSRRNLKEVLSGKSPEWSNDVIIPIDKFINDPIQLGDLLSDKEMLESVLKHVRGDFPFEEKPGKDSSNQRMNLYERTLKQQFPQYEFSREGYGIVLSLK